jgi:hypothetical protein
MKVMQKQRRIRKSMSKGCVPTQSSLTWTRSMDPKRDASCGNELHLYKIYSNEILLSSSNIDKKLLLKLAKNVMQRAIFYFAIEISFFGWFFWNFKFQLTNLPYPK